jgi:hypothetical protein
VAAANVSTHNWMSDKFTAHPTTSAAQNQHSVSIFFTYLFTDAKTVRKQSVYMYSLLKDWKDQPMQLEMQQYAEYVYWVAPVLKMNEC